MVWYATVWYSVCIYIYTYKYTHPLSPFFLWILNHCHANSVIHSVEDPRSWKFSAMPKPVVTNHDITEDLLMFLEKILTLTLVTWFYLYSEAIVQICSLVQGTIIYFPLINPFWFLKLTITNIVPFIHHRKTVSNHPGLLFIIYHIADNLLIFTKQPQMYLYCKPIVLTIVIGRKPFWKFESSIN
jgi:hypothetical protein